MTGEELVKMWAEESNAANDIIIDILESYMEFASLVLQHGELRSEHILGKLATRRIADWQPILEHAKNAKAVAQQSEP